MNDHLTLPCPFCGSTDISVQGRNLTDPDPSNHQWVVRCDNQDCRVAPYSAECERQDAIDSWNSRDADLLLCPFCGSHPEIRRIKTKECRGHGDCVACGECDAGCEDCDECGEWQWFVRCECQVCSVNPSVQGKTAHLAAMAWNNRPK